MIRKPTGPDGTRGFTQPRTLWSPSGTPSDHAQGCAENGTNHTPEMLENGAPAEEGHVLEDLVAKICD